MENKEKSFLNNFKNIPKLIIILIFLIAVTNISIFNIEGNSMYPTMENGDTLITIFPFSTKENQIVVVADPYNKVNIVKRIISKGENTLYIKNGNLYINNQYKSALKNHNSFFPRLLIQNKEVVGIQTDYGWTKVPTNILINVPKIPEEIQIYSYIKPIIYDSYYSIPKNEIFLLGDNTELMGSIDSREIGSIPTYYVKGILLFRIKNER